MSKQNEFKWDDSALIPATLTVDFTPLLPEGSSEPAKVTFHEFSRTELTAFMTDGMLSNVFEMEEDGITAKRDTQGLPIKRPFEAVEKYNSQILFEHLSVSTGRAKPPEFFAGLRFTASTMAAFLDAWMKMQHIEEVIATSGNWMMLPTITNLFAGANESESVTQAEILPA